MFCDLVGYTELARRVDIEDLSRLVASYQDACSEIVVRWGGSVAQYLGDGVLVYFGYPVAHEDDAVRAAHAACALLAELPAVLRGIVSAEPPALRIGIHTGPVVVDKLGARTRREQLAVGSTVNIASRLQALADPDSTLVSRGTRELLGDVFELEDRGPAQLKGIEAPVPVFRLLGVRSGGRAELQPGRRFVGRRTELSRLERAFRETSDGAGRVVLVRGEPGLGKSRLVRALQHSIEGLGAAWLECGAYPFQTQSAFHVIASLLRERLASGAEGTGLAGRLWGPHGEGMDEVGVALLAGLAGAESEEASTFPPLSGEARRARTLDALVRWCLDRADTAPAVLVVEDLHWADPSTLEFLERLSERIAPSRLMLVLTARTDFEPAGPLARVEVIELGPLDADEIESLVRGVEQAGTLSRDALRAVVAQADGVPLFAEELAKTLVETREIHVPATLQDSLMARLDGLGTARSVAQLAAVVGRRFSQELLADVWPGAPDELPRLLDRLVASDLVLRKEGTADLEFRHALFQEVAYDSLLRRDRMEHHRRIAEILRDRHTARTESAPEEMARHCEAAGFIEDAADYCLRAGTRAASRSALHEAIAHLRHALSLLETLDPGPRRERLELSVRMALGGPLQAVRGHADPEVVATYERALVLSHDQTSERVRSDVLWGLFSFNLVRGAIATAGERAAELAALSASTGDTAMALAAHNARGPALYYVGEFEAALEQFERAVSLYRREEHGDLAFAHGQDPGAIARVNAALAHWVLGRPESALRRAEEAVALARTIGHPFSLAFCLGYAGAVGALRREPDRVGALASELVGLATEQCFPLWAGFGRILLGWALSGGERDEEGAAALRQGIQDSGSTGATFEAPFCAALVADAHLRAGRVGAAVRSLDMGVVLAKRNGSPYWDAELSRLRGECARTHADRGSSSEWAQAESCFRSAIAVAGRQRARALELRARVSAARLLADGDRLDDARALLGLEHVRPIECTRDATWCEAASLREEIA